MDAPGWWAYIYPKNLDQFEQPKIMLPDYHDAPAAGLDPAGRYYSITAYCVTVRPDSPLTLASVAAMLNSRLLFWTLSKIGAALQRGFVRFMPQYLDRLPMVVPSEDRIRRLEALTQAAMRNGFRAVQAELDELVYDLYGVMPEERALLSALGSRS